ncbi:hypothetical protein CSA37_12180 [Candidatus Fermentibacteria bacterium]|nr:MAG: hypothetical protein CSA37_12180 [Candidatus Fermentibacteria bacterium]
MRKCIALILLSLLSAVIGCGSSPSDTDTTPPDPSVISSTVDFSLVQLSWDQCTSDDFAEYKLYRSTASGVSQNPGTPLASFSSISDLTYNDSDVQQDETYYYALETIDENSLSSWSNEIQVDTPVEAIAGYWEGRTDQGKTIYFYVTTDMTVGQCTVTLDISGAPDLTPTFTGYIDYDINGSWTMSGNYEAGGVMNSITITGTFTSSNLCSGSVVASSEDYYGGYYIDTEFTTYPN